MNINDPKLIQMLGEIKHFPKTKKEELQKIEIEKIPPEELIRVYRVNEPIVEILQNAKSEMDEDAKTRQWRIRRNYEDEKSMIDNAMHDRLAQFDEDTANNKKEIDDKITKLNTDIHKVHRIKYLLEAKNTKLEFDRKKINGSRNFIEKFEDDCLLLHAYIHKNRRPKKQYTLTITGFCKFGSSEYQTLGRKILELPKDWGSDLDAHGSGVNIIKEIEYFPSELDAINYIKRIGIKGSMYEFFRNYNLVKQEFDQVNEFYNLADFKEIKEDDKE